MKPSNFEYVKPKTVSEALELLGDQGRDAVVLAGGQSLMPTLNMRLSSPEILVDINGLDDLAGISVKDKTLRIGALTRHQAIENSLEIEKHAPLISLAMPHIAHPAIRNRGTFGGSIALADPAAELPACLCALRADIEVADRNGSRTISANKFFKGLYQTDIKEGELVTAIKIPILETHYVSAFKELARRHGDYAMAGIAAHAKIDGEVVSDANFCFFAIAERPVLGVRAAELLNGRQIDEDIISEAQSSLEGDLEPIADLNCSSAIKLHYAKELFGRVVRELVK
ncbi:MAG: xanthine dehydrogenase family protein subunit M [Pseudomonadota bacterium]|nr:xanthine dehydrogenase family protein subunit M [Pseudomonadota bacterium]